MLSPKSVLAVLGIACALLSLAIVGNVLLVIGVTLIGVAALLAKF